MNFHIKVTMKFLHVFDTGGFGAVMAGAGSDTHEVLQLNQFDTFGFAEYYKGTTEFFERPQELITKAVAIQDQYDHIIFNDFPDAIDQFKSHPSKTVIYHGSSLRQNPGRKEDLKADLVIVDDIDLCSLRPDAQYMPFPIDRELFSPRECGEGMILHLRPHGMTPWLESDYPHMFNDLKIILKGKPFCKYVDFPAHLALYETYLEVRWDFFHPPHLIMSISCTGLEMLSIGGNVMDNEYNMITSFPEEHDLVNLYKEFQSYYE